MCFLQQQQHVLAPSALEASSKGDEPFSQLVLSDVSNPYMHQMNSSPESKPLSSMREEDFQRSEETAERFQDLGEITEEEEAKKEAS